MLAKINVFLSLKIVFILANSADPGLGIHLNKKKSNLIMLSISNPTCTTICQCCMEKTSFHIICNPFHSDGLYHTNMY